MFEIRYPLSCLVSYRRAMNDKSTSQRGIPKLSTEALQSLIHSKMQLEQHMRRQAKKKQHLSTELW